MSPFRINWKNCNTGQKDATLIYANSQHEAEYLFHLSRGMSFIITQVEFDVKQSELDTALLIAYRAKQQAAQEVRKTLKACKIDIRSVKSELKRLNLPI